MTIRIQLGLTFIWTFGTYIVSALLENDFGTNEFGLFGEFIVQLILGVILSAFTITVCFIIGLPIRLNKKIHKWWTNRFYISIIGTLVGITMLFLTLMPQFKETATIKINGQEAVQKIPNLFILYTGWFLTAFMTLHIFPPDILKSKF